MIRPLLLWSVLALGLSDHVEEAELMMDVAAYLPCYPRPQEATVTLNNATTRVTFTNCGDEGVGNQSLWWRAVEPAQQCFGLGMPNPDCSKSTTNRFQCLVGDHWDELRDKLRYPTRSRTGVAKLEMGNWYSMSLQAAVARILLEEMMNYPVELVGRTGTHSAFERVSRHRNYLTMEAWTGPNFNPQQDNYILSDLPENPFVEDEESGGIAYAANLSAPLAFQPEGELRRTFLAISETNVVKDLLGATGTVGIFVNGPAIQDRNIYVEFWRGLQERAALEVFPPDGTIRCEDRLKSGTSCADPEASFHCDTSCPSVLWDGSSACCYHGKFHPPQCIPEGVTGEDIRADPNWASPLCRELIHPDASWDVSYFEAVLVNLKLNFTINYMGPTKLVELVKRRTGEGVPTIFYWYTPDTLIESVNATLVVLPKSRASCLNSFSLDPLVSKVDCQMSTVHLSKLASVDVRINEPDLYSFWSEFSMTNEDYSALLELHVSGGGRNETIDEAACQWVRENPQRWTWMVSNQAVPRGTSTSSKTVLILVVVFVGFGALLISLLVMLRWNYNMTRLQGRLGEVRWSELEFSNPPVCLHKSPEGLRVLRATYLGQPVTVKELGIEEATTNFRDAGVNEMMIVSIDGITNGVQSKSKSGQLSSIMLSEVDGGSISSGGFPKSNSQKSLSRTKTITVGQVQRLRMETRLKSMKQINLGGKSSRHLSFHKSSLPSLKKEMQQIMQLRHHNLKQYYGWTRSPTNKPAVVYEYREGSLSHLIHNCTIMLDQEIRLSMIKSIASVMKYLHTRSPVVTHGNLASSNILVDSNFNVKVADLVKTWRRPPRFYAPEVAMGGLPDKRSDVWSFGVLMYEVFSQKVPFAKVMTEQDVDEPGEGARDEEAAQLLPVLQLNTVMCNSEVVRSICHSCQSVDPRKRPTFSEICEQLELVETSSLVTQMNQLVEKQKLLYDILPAHVATTLAEGKKVNPERYEEITLFFSDIVGFTTISQTLAPMQVMAMLDRLYGEFDKLTMQYGLFKVETIGDAYMCAGNLITQQPDHACRVVRFARDTIRVANETLVDQDDAESDTINIRVGLHTGPVVASVVGKTNPRYCLFGDTVNTASRMESNSERNCIHVSASTALKLVEVDCMRLIPRGHIPIKGKGEMETFWLRGYAPPEVSMSFSNPSSMHPSRQGSLALSAGPGPLDSFSDISARSGT